MRMKSCRFASWSSRIALSAALCSVPALAAAENYQVPCNKGGDQLGFSIATNGDFNGDGVKDIAIGSPCMFIRGKMHAGRVIVVDGDFEGSGHPGRILFNKHGAQENQWFGASVSFLGDINLDGRDELAIGSPGYDVSIVEQKDPEAKALDRAGRVDVYQRRHRRYRVFGTAILAGLGEKIAPLNDINDDGRPDFVATASGDRNANGRSQPGRAWTISGRNGDKLAYRIGPKEGNSYGRSLASAGDLDGDGLVDFLVGSDESNYPGVLKAGIVDAISSPEPLATPLFQVVGAKQDRIGKAIDFAGLVNDDLVPDMIVGSDGSDDTGVKLAGLVTLFDLNGNRIWVRSEPHVQEGARFGDAVTRLGDINGDGIIDFAASASKHDIILEKTLLRDAGRVITMSGVDGEQIWSRDGNRKDEEFGFSLDGDIDYNLDEVPDVVVGTPGDNPFGRRGAGSVQILSGVDGSVLLMIPGRRGLETRLIVASYDEDGDARLRAFNRHGKRRDMNLPVLEEMHPGELSTTILNDDPFNKEGDPHVPEPKKVQVAVAGGFGANKSTVEVYRLGKDSTLIDSFEAFPGSNAGVDCTGGEINGEVNEELVCAQADSAGGNVNARVFVRLDEDTPFFVDKEFQLFQDTDQLNEFTPIDAEGANLAIGNVTGDKNNEIIAGTTRGVPLVKIFNRDGQLIRSFLAYDPVANSGVDVALIDLNGSGDQWILTAPREGPALIKVFDGNGERVGWGPDNTLISILARPAPWVGGARVAAADIDLDDQQEILVLVPGPDGEQQVLAYEPTNAFVKKFIPFNPLPLGVTGGAIAATDRWVRN